MQMRPSGSLCTREPAAWGEICIIRIIRCRGRSLEDAAWISLSSRVSLLLSHVPDVTPAVRTVRRRCFSLASQPRAPLCSATAGASGSPSQGSSPQLDTRSEAPPPGGPARRLAQGPPPPVGSQAAASGQHRLLQHLRPLPHRQRPARFLWARAGRARAGAPVVSGPRFPFRGPLPLGAALQERPGTPGPRPDPTPVRLKLVSPSPG